MQFVIGFCLGGGTILALRAKKKRELIQDRLLVDILLRNNFDRLPHLRLDRLSDVLDVNVACEFVQKSLESPNLHSLDLRNNPRLFLDHSTETSDEITMRQRIQYLISQLRSFTYNGLEPTPSRVISAFDSATELHSLNIDSNALSDTVGARIVPTFPQSTLTELSMSRNQLGLSTIDALASLLRRGVLKYLSLDANPLTPEAFIRLMEALSDDACSVTRLSLNSIFTPSSDSIAHALSAHTAAAIKDTLQRNGSLQDLDIGNNEIDDFALAMILEGMAHNSHLHTLSLDQNPFKGQCIASMIGTARLEVLSLLGTCLSDENGANIALALADNTSLKALVLDRTHVGERTATAILDVLQKNDSILYISMQHTLIPEPLISQIESILQERRSALEPVLYRPFECQIRIQHLKYEINSLNHQISTLK